jgi:anti-anti-sigma factor
MQQQIKVTGDQMVVTIDGRITDRDHGSFRSIIELIKGGQLKRVTLSLAGAEFIDSAGLGMFLLLRDAAAERKTEVVLAGAQGQVLRLIEASKFGSLFKVTA